MIALGIIDPNLPEAVKAEYFNTVKQVTRQDWGGRLRGEENEEWVSLRESPEPNEMSVKEVQTVLREADFFPNGKVDGICGYRTTSAIRLFQEYLRTVGNEPGVFPDGIAGPHTFGHLKKWRDNKWKADWSATLQAWKNGFPGGGQTEYQKWLAFLNKVKQHYLANPNKMLALVNAYPLTTNTDTVKVANWDFDPKHIHLAGIRRKGQGSGAAGSQRFDDVIILLIKGLVFKFQGSTDPGATTNPKGAAFLTQGQHNYHFGWHLLSKSQRTYQALKPLSSLNSTKANEPPPGVLVVRSKGDFVVDEADLAKGLDRNNEINVHWGGEGGAEGVGSWSEGCQVITGIGYLNHHNQPVDCSKFVAAKFSQLGQGKTKGAYNVLNDVVAALSSDTSGVVKYMLLVEEDLALSPEIGGIIAQAREHARKMF